MALGRPPGATDKPWREAIRAAVNSREKDGGKRLRLIAEKLSKLAAAGDVAAIKEIGDRLDGRPAQQHSGDANADPIKHVFVWGETPIDPKG